MGKKCKLSALLIGVVIFALGFFPSPSLSKEKVKIVLKPQAEVAGDFIYLGEIVESIKAEEMLRQKLMGIKVGSSPLPGGKRQLNKDYVMVRLYQNGFSPGEVLVEGSYEVLVVRKSFTFLSEKKQSRYKGESYLIKRGDEVNLVIEDENLKIITKGKALEPGKRGEIIEVFNTSSFKKIKGKVVAPFTVKIDIPKS